MGDLVGRIGAELPSPCTAFGDRPLANAGPAHTAFRGPFLHRRLYFEPAFRGVHGTVNNREFGGASIRLLTKRQEAEERSKKPPAFAKTKKLKQLRSA
jgi:hypothetical protein